MNEFIFWDKVAQKFYDNEKSFYDDNENYKCALVNGKALVHHYYNEYEEDLINPYKEDNMIIPLSYIGLKDINNNKIYADSSIVEFGYKVGNASHIGYFFYSNKDLSYKLKILSKKFNNEEWSYCSSMAELIIIDTIQENKLGLIKDKE